MNVLSHRGYWKHQSEKNSIAAFTRSFSMGFGTETDIRDQSGKLVVSHDPPQGHSLNSHECFRLLEQFDSNLPIAINIKSDGLQELLLGLVNEFRIRNYFLFDMSVPDALRSLAFGLRCFTRHSDVEPRPAFYEKAHGIWMDSFESDWITIAAIKSHLSAGKHVCIVSPELHGRDHLDLWKRIRQSKETSRHPHLMICTDLPEHARQFFS
jgi:hypothetical protein